MRSEVASSGDEFRAPTGIWMTAVCVLVVACGYAPVRKGGAHGAISVPPVRNDTAQAEVGGWLQSEARAELAGRGRLSDEGQPLQLELVSIRSFPSAMQTEGASAWRIEATVRASGGAFEDAATGTEDYLAGVDVAGTEANRRTALRRLARNLARELVERFEVSEKMAP